MILNGVDTTNVKVTLPTKKDGANVLTYNTNLGELMLWARDMYGVFRDYYVNENNKMNPDALTDSVLSGINPIMRHIWGQTFLHYNSSIGLFGTRQHILVIPNWKEDEQTALYDAENTTDNYDFNNPNHHIAPNPNLIGCFWPCIKRKIGGFQSITVALPSEYSLLKHFYRQYGVRVIECSKPYALGEDTYSGFTLIDPPHKFDVVQLLGHDRPEEGTVFRAEDIKDDFKRYCNDDFLLHDLWRPKGTLWEYYQKGNSAYYGIEGTESAEARKNLEELYAWFHTFQFGQSLDLNNDSDVLSTTNTLNSVLGPRRILGRDSDKSIGKMYTVDEKIEETGSYRNLANEWAGMLLEHARQTKLCVF